jgi:mRNA-degrading endonuclease RelE of RelBE toxin-antitoxin system
MAFRLAVIKSAKKQIDRLSEKERARVIRALEIIQASPFVAGRPLHGDRAAEYSYRVGPYRIIYRIEKSILLILVIDFGPRSGIY